MIFQHTLDQLKSGNKTLTHRLARPDQIAAFVDGTVARVGKIFDQCPVQPPPSEITEIRTNTGRLRYRVGGQYAVQACRGGQAEAHIRIKSIRLARVIDATEQDAQREGFTDNSAFQFQFTLINGVGSTSQPAWRIEFEVLHG